MPSRYDRDIKAKAIRLVRDHAGDYKTERAAIRAISGRRGMSAETLRAWLRQAQVDASRAPGAPGETAREIRETEAQERRTGAHHRHLEGGHEFLSRGSATRQPLICALMTCCGPR